MYCSKKCLSRANELYHNMECEVFAYSNIAVNNTNDHTDDSIILMAQRTLLIGTRQGTELRNLRLMERLQINDIFAENADLQNISLIVVDEYLTVLKLCRTFNYALLSDNEINDILRTVISLRRAGFFGNADGNYARVRK